MHRLDQQNDSFSTHSLVAEPQLSPAEVSPAFSDVLTEIATLTERDLQSRIVEPLLRNMGFTNVYDNSGPNERGKDVIATIETFGRIDLYAIQIKKYRPSGKHGSKNSLGILLDQLRSAVFEPVLDPTTNKKRAPNRVVFITPYAIHPSVREQFEERADVRELRGLTLIDGPQLLDLIRKHLPEAVGNFSIQSQYRLRLAADMNRIPEVAVAFEGTRDIRLDQIYVDASIGVEQKSLYDVAFSKRRKRFKNRWVTKDRAAAMDQLLSEWTQQPLAQVPRIVGKGLAREGEVNLNLPYLLETIVERAKHAVAAIETISREDSAKEDCTKAVLEINSVGQRIQRLKSDPAFRDFWPILVPQHEQTDIDPSSFRADRLMKVQLPVVVLGAPGSGKTTLLKKICQTTASIKGGLLPVFLPMVLLGDASPGGIIRACSKQMSLLGFSPAGKPVAESVLAGQMESGEISMCLDGLDETGAMAKDALSAVKSLAIRYPKCRIILSSRDTVKVSEWEHSFVVRLNPFSDEELLSTPVEISSHRRLKIPPPRKLSDADQREAPEKQLSLAPFPS